jgi:hypothetical protein
MRDFKAGRDINVEGGVHIRTESSQPKSLSMCTNEELFNERTHRKTLLSSERKRKGKFIAVVCVVIGGGSGLAALWFYTQGNSNLSSLILGLGGIAMAFTSLEILKEPSEFEARQLAALQEIKLILRERGLN